MFKSAPDHASLTEIARAEGYKEGYEVGLLEGYQKCRIDVKNEQDHLEKVKTKEEKNKKKVAMNSKKTDIITQLLNSGSGIALSYQFAVDKEKAEEA